MGTGWRRAFCTTTSRDRDATGSADAAAMDRQQQQSPSPSPRSCSRLGFFKTTTAYSSTSNSSTPRRLRCKVNTNNNSNVDDENGGNQTLGDCLVGPNLHCKTNTKSPKSLLGSNPSSPRSPFSILKNTLRLTRNSSCGVCMQSVRRGQGMAIYTAECSHTFHFPCIAAHLKKQPTLVCPVCTTTWKDVPLLAIHKQPSIDMNPNSPAAPAPNLSNKFQDQVKKERTPTGSPRPYHQHDQITKCSAYADDEPLLTPRANAGVIPIPEANEAEEDNDDEIEEFKGFFVNPVSSSADHESLISGLDVEVRIMPEAAIVSVNRTHVTYAIVLRVKAPPPPPAVVPPTQNKGTANFLDPSRRAPIDLVTVLDVSASMGGAKLQMLKRAMRLVISSLGSADRLSIVAFSASPKRMMPLKRMTVHGQRSARRIIDRLVCSQGSCAAEALKKATKVLEDRRERNPVASIMLLSDGQDEQVQETEPNQRSETANVSSTRFAHVEIPVHDFAYGGKSCSYASEPAENAFAKCVGGLLSVVVQDLRLQLGLASGSDPAEITAVYSCNGRPTVLSSGCIRLGDLYAEEEREILVEMRVPRSSVAGPHHVLTVRCCIKDPATQEVIYGAEKALLVPRAQPVRSSTPRIERLRNLFIATRAVAESRQLVEHNELSTAQRLLSSARALVMQSSSIWADEYARGLEAELAEVHWRKQYQQQLEQHQQRRGGIERELGLMVDENGEPLTPTSAWRAAEKLAKVAVMKKSMNRVSDLHGFENARF